MDFSSDILRPVIVYEALLYYSDRDLRAWTRENHCRSTG